MVRTINNTPKNPFGELEDEKLLTEYEKLLIDVKGSKNPNIKKMVNDVEKALVYVKKERKI